MGHWAGICLRVFLSVKIKIEGKENIHENLKKLNWEKGFFRKDIGYKVINK